MEKTPTQPNQQTIQTPSITRMAKKKRSKIPTDRIAELGVVTAAVTVVYIFTGPLIDNIIPYVGCILRTIAVGVFLSGVRHYAVWELLLINIIASTFYFFFIPCLNSFIGIPAAFVFVATYASLRRYMQAWLVTTIASILSYGAMIAVLAIWEPSKFYEKFMTALSWSWILLIAIPLLAWWRQRRSNDVGCAGCTMSCESNVFKEQ